MDAGRFWTILKRRGLTFFAGVPDSTLSAVYSAISDDEEVRYVPAVREDVALGISSAAYLTGEMGGVLMQNSGIGNIVNPLSSFNLIYRIPVLLVIGWRGAGGPETDAPEHWIMGEKTCQILDLLEVPYITQDDASFEKDLDELLRTMKREAKPGAVLVHRGAITQ